MSIDGKNNEILVDEFNVQLYSNGRIAWDRLDAFIEKNAVKRNGLRAYLRQKLTRGTSADRAVAA
jgi:hypothetical protein